MPSTNIRFNGAVPVKARKAQHWGGGRPIPGVLQWGRACEGTEGPRTTLSLFRPDRLQWGRACEGTEGLRQGLRPRPARRFNGAVPLKARKAPYVNQKKYCVRTLQWGRASKGTEGSPPIMPTIIVLSLQWGRASKGTEGGRLRAWRTWPVTLQWGRASKGTEGPRPTG